MPPDQKAFQTWSTCDLMVASMGVPSLRAPWGASGILSDIGHLPLGLGDERDAARVAAYEKAAPEREVDAEALQRGRRDLTVTEIEGLVKTMADGGRGPPAGAGSK
ncbi:hypothetical protein SOM11_05265 [Frigoribacterium sp. CFBP9039]|uniref:hypothetical protein n=1 Tax=Frigoribacterium sp. CFBP9029 TaxID=3096541 RepID=UPI002A6B8DA1|nr:hypothetical protein [Frigoribacterium sp. CFBP9039]MDY0945392.1 hypothetical protein [Frigoribacterium sp. CFBP9039]